MSAVVVTRGLTKRFGAVTAVDGLDIEVAQGEVFGFLGPNGAGKTMTTIRLLLDVLRLTSGSVEVLGGSPGDTRVRARIGFLPAELHLDPRHTANDAITFLGALRGGFREPDVGALLERFDLDPGRRPVGRAGCHHRGHGGDHRAVVSTAWAVARQQSATPSTT